MLIILCILSAAISESLSQTMTVRTINGDKTYNIGNVAGITFGTLKHDTIEMALLPLAGMPFAMGSLNGGPDEKPIHPVTLTRQFSMSRFEVTQKQYAEVIGSNPSSFPGNYSNPVDNVSWLDAVQFCNLLSDREGLEQCYTLQSGMTWVCDFDKKGYRLPTEAEWEYACRAGTLTDYYTGATASALDKAGWFVGNTAGATDPVGLKLPNTFGLYDMHGNVWEWCWDLYGGYGADPLTDPAGPPDTGQNHVARGGAWDTDAYYCRYSFRSSSAPNFRNNNLGFRIARTK